MLLTNAYDPDPRVRQEALALTARGYGVTVLAWDRDLKSPAAEVMQGVQIKRVFLSSQHGRGSTQMFFYPVVYMKMLLAARRIEFDALHCHDLDTMPVGIVLGRIKRVPVVYDAHESFTDMLEGNIHPLLQWLLVRVENYFLRRIQLLITVGRKLRRHFVERGARHAVVVGNWKPVSEYARTAEQNRAVRCDLAIPPQAMTVVCITQLFVDRKIPELLDAVDRCSDVYLIIGGKGALEPLVRERAARNPRIKFVGFVTADSIPKYTCAADAVYYGFNPDNPNSRFSAPNKLFEALAAGRPLITGDFGEIAETVRGANCGVVLASYTAESICHAFARLSDTAAREEMGRNAAICGQAQEDPQAILDREYSKLLRSHVAATSSAMISAKSSDTYDCR